MLPPPVAVMSSYQCKQDKPVVPLFLLSEGTGGICRNLGTAHCLLRVGVIILPEC